MPWFLYLALRQLFPAGRRFPFFTAISVMGVALGVTLLVVVMSVMGGFGFEIRRMIVETEGEVQVKSALPIDNWSELIAKIERVPGVAAATPYATGAVMVLHEGKPAYPMMRGLDLASVDRVVNLAHYVRVGSLDDLDDDSVILSSELARSMGIVVGESLEIYS
ncbi:MAG TPA: ABC transporter permease, partial [Opitutaceae bacterium]|nr:ABC transporter permease [Opitutaceae bacterium]